MADDSNDIQPIGSGDSFGSMVSKYAHNTKVWASRAASRIVSNITKESSLSKISNDAQHGGLAQAIKNVNAQAHPATQGASAGESGYPSKATGSTAHGYNAGLHSGTGASWGRQGMPHAEGSRVATAAPHTPVSHPGTSATHTPVKAATGQRGHSTVHPPAPHTSQQHQAVARNTRPQHATAKATGGTQHGSSHGAKAGHPAKGGSSKSHKTATKSKGKSKGKK